MRHRLESGIDKAGWAPLMALSGAVWEQIRTLNL